MKVLGVDYGNSRTGLAVSDAAGVTCRPLNVLSERDVARVTEVVTAIAKEERAEAIVVGLPRPLSGGTNEQLEHVLDFVGLLRSVSSLPVETWDERFTSVLAERGNRKHAARDSVAACYMLQNYLDSLSAEGRR